MITDGVFIGTGLKYIIEVEAEGFSMETDRFTVDLIRGPISMHFEKDDMEKDEENNYYVCFETDKLGTGKVKAKVTAYIPDSDYEDGVRMEVDKFDLVQIIS